MAWSGQRWLAAVGLAGALALGGCAYDDGYGYGGMSVGSGYYGSGYYGPSYYSGWYNDYYYPGSGYYVYDRGGKRHRWNDGQRRYWEARRKDRGHQWRDRDRDGRPGWNNGNRPRPDRNRANRGGQRVPGTDYVLPPKARLLPQAGQTQAPRQRQPSARPTRPDTGARSFPRGGGGERSSRGDGRRGSSR